MKHCQSSWDKMLMALAGSGTKYLMDMLEGMFGAPVYSEADDEPNKKQMT